jgi:arylsulfatase
VLADRNAPAANTLQYFEMMGSRALIAGEWKAVCKHIPGADFETEAWELYHLAEDASECNDLAERDSEMLAKLIELWWSEADRHGVLPLDDRGIELFGARFRDRSPHPLSRRYVYRPPMSPIPAQAAAAIGGRGFDLTARITRAAGDDGVLWATGTENSGISVFIQHDRLVVDYNAFDRHTVVESDVQVPAGDTEVTARFRRTNGMAGEIELAIDGVDVGRAELSLYMRVISSVGSSVGYDHGSAVSPRYHAPFAFAGTLHDVEFQLVNAPSVGTAEAISRAEMSRQ